MRNALKRLSRMKLPAPITKVPREIARAGDQLENFLHRISGVSLARIHSKLVIEPRVKKIQGEIPLGTNAALYLIFPSNGLLQSHLIALDHIVQNGYSPIAISNWPLTPQEQKQVLQRCHALVLRPNSGYDFAGYRDAIRLFREDITKLDHLAILNDSGWFPANSSVSWLAQAESKGLDFVGSVSHGGQTREMFAKDQIDWRIERTNPMFHYGSFSLLIGANILRSSTFYEFWSNYRPASLKTNTIRRGEIGFSQWVIQNGFSHGETLGADNLPELLAKLSTERLLQIARNAVTFDRPRPNDTRRDAIFANPPQHAALVRFILTEVFKSAQAYALQDFDVFDRDGCFIKKLPITKSKMTADQTLDMLSRINGPYAAAFQAEALEMYRRKFGEAPQARLQQTGGRN